MEIECTMYMAGQVGNIHLRSSSFLPGESNLELVLIATRADLVEFTLNVQISNFCDIVLGFNIHTIESLRHCHFQE